MTVTLNSAGGASVPNWQLLTALTLSGSGSSSFAVTNYSKYRILIPTATCLTGSDLISVQLNFDTGGNYTYANSTLTSGTWSSLTSVGATSVLLGAISNSSTCSYQVDIDNGLISAPKFITGSSVIGTAISSIVGHYNSTSNISEITIKTNTYNFASGTAYILGAN